MKSMGWTTKDTLKSINREINGTQQQPRQAKCRTQAPTCCERCSCECVKKIESTILRSPPKTQQHQQPSYALSKERESEEAFTRKSPKSLPHYALPQHCNRQERLEPLQQQQSSKIASKPPNVKRQSKTNLISGGVELVPLLAKRREYRPISLSTTDITKYKINQSR